jgi:hypothetical protein
MDVPEQENTLCAGDRFGEIEFWNIALNRLEQ